MARQLRTDSEIDAFIASVIQQATHHATSVATVIQPLSDEVRGRLNLGRDKVEVYERDGKIARTCWVTIKGKRYVFSYNYQDAVIDLKDRSTQGRLRCRFDNSTSLTAIQQEVARL